jgi:hypothetical protein
MVALRVSMNTLYHENRNNQLLISWQQEESDKLAVHKTGVNLFAVYD